MSTSSRRTLNTQSDSNDTLIVHHDDAIGGEFRRLAITTNDFASQYFIPNLPDSATQWGITQVRLLLRSFGNIDGKIAVSIVKADSDGRPTASVFETHEIE